MQQDIYQSTGFLRWYKREIEPRMMELASMQHQVKKIEVKYINCDNGSHDFKREYTGHNDDYVMWCDYCNTKYNFEDDGSGDFTGASYDEWGGR